MRTRQPFAALVFATSCSLALGPTGCKREQPSAPAARPPLLEVAPAASAGVAGSGTGALERTAGRVLDEIGKLETTKDVTCWTTFRQMDAFISQKEYSHFATLAKVSATKALVRALWAKAAVAAGAAAVSADHVKAAAALPAPGTAERDSKLAAFASDKGLKAYQDYRTTSEHWRVLLAVLMDELQAGGASPLRSPDDKGLAELAEATTRLGLLLLRRAGEAAVDERTPFIEATAVQRAHDELRAKYDLRGPPLVHVERPYAEVAAQLAPLSRRLIEAKIAALHAYNRNTQDLVADMNRLANLPLDAPAVERMKQDLQSFAHFVAAGFEPMQADNFLADGQFAETALQRKAYIDAAHAENATLQLFPHLILPNGDLRLRFEPHPGRPGTAGLQGYDVHILDHEQNGVRDTAIHWLALQQVWTEKPFAMEPFAAEYLSEVLSMMATVWLRRAEALARAAGKASIGVEMMDAVRDPRFAMVLPRQDGAAPVWTADVMARKAAVFAAAGPARFEDVTHQVGLPTAVPAVPEGRKGFDIHRVMGAGIALGDIDDDGFADLFLAGEGLGRLYRNRGKAGPGVFDDATLAWGITATGLDDATQPLFLDREGDGDLDLLVLRADGATLLYEQERAGHFIERAAELGLVTHRGAHTVTAFDSDRDGDLDLYVGCYGSDAANRTQTATRNLPSLDGRNGTPHQLFRLGDDGRYTESADVAGLADTGWTLALGTFDFDRDGDLDVVLANDFGRDGLYRNDAGVFKDVSGPTRTDDRGSGMNVSFTDADGDGRLDMYVTNIDMFSKNIKVVYPNDASTIHNLDERLARAFQYIAGNKLYRNPGDDKASVPWPPIERAVFEPGDRGWAWAGVFFDWENDGDEDLYLTNGWIEGSFAADQRNQLFLQQDGRFWLAPADAAEAFAGNSRAAVAADFDGDGDVDLAVNSFRQPFRYLRNVQARGQHWIGLRLRMPGTRNPRAVGAFVEVTVAGRRQVRQVTCGGLYLGQDEGVVRVGIGAALEADVAVHWPDGRRTGWKARAGRVSDGVR